jgi:sporulation protein YlmC with PRC-barrel domain
VVHKLDYKLFWSLIKKGWIQLLMKKEILGKEVVDTSGIVIGKVEDVEVNFETQTLEGFMVGKGGFMFGRSSGGVLIPYDVVRVVGDKVLLTRDFHD